VASVFASAVPKEPEPMTAARIPVSRYAMSPARLPMPRSSPIELLSFRRTFALLMVLVAVPSAGLTGLGVVAILNERAAVGKRLGAGWQDRLETPGTRLPQTPDPSTAGRTAAGGPARAPPGHAPPR